MGLRGASLAWKRSSVVKLGVFSFARIEVRTDFGQFWHENDQLGAKRVVFVHNYKCANLTQCNMQHVHSPVPHRYRHHHHAHHHRDHAACLHCFTPSWMSPRPRVEVKTITNHKLQITKMSSIWMSPRWRVNVKVHSLPKKHCFWQKKNTFFAQGFTTIE